MGEYFCFSPRASLGKFIVVIRHVNGGEQKLLMEEMIREAMARGVKMHMAGEFDLASQSYGSVIKLQPNHADANHSMGILTVGFGTFHEGLPFFKTALESNPSNPNFWLSYIDALVQLERLVAAKAVFDQAKERGAEGDALTCLNDG